MEQTAIYNSYRKYLIQRFGGPVLKVSLNAGFSCPNRDGTKSIDGCTFCDNWSFSPASQNITSPVEQLRKVIRKKSNRFHNFLPYLQPFSNTYGTVERLRATYEPLLDIEGVIGLAVGTRPDCFTSETVDYMGALAQRTYMSIELGLQSSHDQTLLKVNRGHSWDQFITIAGQLAELGIEIVVHVMIGLPGETESMIIETAERLNRLPIHGIKIHQMMVISGTQCERDYTNGALDVLDIGEYARLLGAFLARLRPDIHIHRIVANSKQEFGLVAPLWSAEKDGSIATIHKYLEINGIYQGMLY